MITLALSLIGMVVSLTAMMVARRSYHRTRRLLALRINRAHAPRCYARVIPGVRCALHAGHARTHLVDPAELVAAGYTAPPF